MAQPRIGVVVVTYNSGAEAVACLETLLASARAAALPLQVAVVDNASADDTVARIAAWARGDAPGGPDGPRPDTGSDTGPGTRHGTPPGRARVPSPDLPADLPFAVPPLAGPLTLDIAAPGAVPAADADVMVIRAPENLGFAGGVNLGLESLAAVPEIGHFWILNPDTVTSPEALAALAAWLEAPPDYALMGGRVTYVHKPDRIQIDGGTIDWRTGATGNLNLGRSHAATPAPSPDRIDFVMGGSMVASRAFYDRAGPLEEEYFLYYEEVDWAMRRGTLPLAVCPDLRVYHHSGTAIGSPGGGTGTSPLSAYFKHRGRMMFLRRFRPQALPVAALYTLWTALRQVSRGGWPVTVATLAGGFGFPPPRKVAARLGPAARARLRRRAAARRPVS